MMRHGLSRTVRGFCRRAAAPEGGAQQWVRGCAIWLAVTVPGSIAAQDLPSGQAVDLYDVLIDEVSGEDWVRFRFLAPAIARGAGGLSYAEAEPDMAALCADLALGYIAEHGLAADKVAITLSDRPVEFGAADPNATQFIEVYRIEGGRCIWEAF